MSLSAAQSSKAQTPRLLPDGLAALSALLGDRLSTAAAVREQHGTDVAHAKASPADAVVFAETTAEVAEIVRICGRYGLPVIPYGTGTSLEGHIFAPLGGISLDVSRMDRVLT